MVGRERPVYGQNVRTAHYDITGLQCSLRTLVGYIRGEWGRENGLHWRPDMSLGEDANRTHDRHEVRTSPRCGEWGRRFSSRGRGASVPRANDSPPPWTSSRSNRSYKD
jgi:hypothetical protein